MHTYKHINKYIQYIYIYIYKIYATIPLYIHTYIVELNAELLLMMMQITKKKKKKYMKFKQKF